MTRPGLMHKLPIAFSDIHIIRTCKIILHYAYFNACMTLLRRSWNYTFLDIALEKPIFLTKEIDTITKTRLYNFDPLKPHIYTVKQGYSLFFLFLLKNRDCGYSLEPPRRGGSNEYPQSMFWAEVWKISEIFYLEIFSFWRWNLLYIWIGMFS